ncbi:hypothetical protein H7J86_20955 [Mycobacterium hackensackense]|uniref:hypothetical protein n=1 Tax=Mycobacterium hackensackense TaxID=228909 RepID=UPI002265A7F9|nr:hypothetical protein [Mycobacterium hackensackense]MCV7254636.1 hypothetical protein [Mycobacterium hackensackense]
MIAPTASVTSVAPTVKAQSAIPARTNPLVAINQAIQSFVHHVQVQYFKTPPKITGYTVPPQNADGTAPDRASAQQLIPGVPWGNADPTPAGATSAVAAAKATVTASTNPLTNAVHGIFSWFKKTFNNTAPTVSISVPTKNVDGTYTGEITASDVDGDPLTIQYTPTTLDGTTAVTDHGDGTFTYTYTPSESVATTPNSTHTFYFVVEETNAAAHFHGVDQIFDVIAQTVLGNLLRALNIEQFYEWPPYIPSAWAWGSDSVTVPIGPVETR